MKSNSFKKLFILKKDFFLKFSVNGNILNKTGQNTKKSTPENHKINKSLEGFLIKKEHSLFINLFVWYEKNRQTALCGLVCGERIA